MSFILKLICNVAILLFIYMSGSYVFSYIDLNFFITWTRNDAWLAAMAITIAYGLVISSILFGLVEKIIPR